MRDIKINSNHVEAIVLEKSGPRMFMQHHGSKRRRSHGPQQVRSHRRLGLCPPGDKLNVAMAFDEANHRLFVVTRNPGKLIVLNSDTGKVVASVPAVGMVDDMAYDAKQKRIYVAGDQFVDVFDQKDADQYDAYWAEFPAASAPRQASWSQN